MFGRQTSSDKSKYKNGKDFLYKIAKIRENRLLKDKQQLIEYHQEGQKEEKVQNTGQGQQQQLFDMVIPFAELQQIPTNQTIQVANTAHQVQEQQKEGNGQKKQQKNKIEVKDSSPIFTHKQGKKQIIGKKQKAMDKQNHKPFTFDDIDDQENDIAENNSQQIQCNQNGINNNQIKKQQLQSSSHEDSCSSSSGEEQIKGMSIMSSSLDGNVVIKITNKKELILSRLPPGIVLKCILRKSSDYFNPQFDFYLNNGLKHIISAKKYSLAKKQIFKLSIQLGKYKQKDIVASILANTLHNVYWLYQQNFVQDEVYHQLKGLVRYQKMLKPAHRQMKVNLFIHDHCPMIVDEQRLGQQVPAEKGLFLKNHQLEGKQSSIKNFSLFDQEDKEYQYLKMCKISENMFEVYIQHPVSPIQAFSICLTRFDAQLK